jgi:hypothetical protein
MESRRRIERISEICVELMAIVDDSRSEDENDEHELIHCVVLDCVQKIRRVLVQSSLKPPIGDDARTHDVPEKVDPPLN